MAATMAVLARLQRAMLRLVRLLGKAGKSVVFAQQRHNRLALAIFGDKGRILPSHAYRNPKTLAPHIFCLQIGGLELLETGFRESPDLVADVGEFLFSGLDQLGQLLRITHGSFLLVVNSPAARKGAGLLSTSLP